MDGKRPTTSGSSACGCSVVTRWAAKAHTLLLQSTGETKSSPAAPATSPPCPPQCNPAPQRPHAAPQDTGVFSTYGRRHCPGTEHLPDLKRHTFISRSFRSSFHTKFLSLTCHPSCQGLAGPLCTCSAELTRSACTWQAHMQSSPEALKDSHKTLQIPQYVHS